LWRASGAGLAGEEIFAPKIFCEEPMRKYGAWVHDFKTARTRAMAALVTVVLNTAFIPIKYQLAKAWQAETLETIDRWYQRAEMCSISYFQTKTSREK